MSEKEHKTEPITEEQYKHIMALLFRNRDIVGVYPISLLASDPYANYYDMCQRTAYKEKKDG